MRYGPLLLFLFLPFAALDHAAQAPTPTESQSTLASPTPIPHRKPSKAKAKSDARIQRSTSSTASPTPEEKFRQTGMGIWRILAGVAFVPLYFLPWVVAASRRHRNRTAIGVANFFLGWTCAGWVAILIWASTADVEPKRQAAVE